MIIFTEAIARHAIWGGTRLAEYFNYPQFPDQTGQSWSFSAQEGEGKSNLLQDGTGRTLLQLWKERPDLFNSRYDRFPFIISLVAPMDDLSLQIHPDDSVAARYGYPSGKNEAWYFLEAETNASIVYGLNAADENSLRQMIAENRWDELMEHLQVKQGDFVYIPSGTVHAMGRGVVVYEIQQATDVTYRFYDYHRKDAAGKERELHIEKAIECVHYENTQKNARITQHHQSYDHAEVTSFIHNDAFCVYRYIVNGPQKFNYHRYQLLTCVAGEGLADGQRITVGKNFLVTAGSELTLDGHMILMNTSED